MKVKLFVFCVFCLPVLVMFTNSCKKASQDYVQTLFTGGRWQLTSVIRKHFVSGANLFNDTLNTACDQKQLFTFSSNGACTYTNFDCLTQPAANGSWTLSPDRLVLIANMTCKDTTAAGSSKPFINARIRNVGQYSMVLRTGMYNSYYPPGDTVVYTDYSFVRVKSQ
ncbi:MAG: hypothetical protein JST32_12015 [Bacteroidetes bacterium]|nr:hypothetical protein [Bacteroidota bacterium]